MVVIDWIHQEPTTVKAGKKSDLEKRTRRERELADLLGAGFGHGAGKPVRPRKKPDSYFREVAHLLAGKKESGLTLMYSVEYPIEATVKDLLDALRDFNSDSFKTIKGSEVYQREVPAEEGPKGMTLSVLAQPLATLSAARVKKYQRLIWPKSDINIRYTFYLQLKGLDPARVKQCQRLVRVLSYQRANKLEMNQNMQMGIVKECGTIDMTLALLRETELPELLEEFGETSKYSDVQQAVRSIIQKWKKIKPIKIETIEKSPLA